MEKGTAEKLAEFGLTKNESRVYLALLEVGPTTTKALIEKSGMHTSKVYEALERLAQKGLARFALEGGRKKFQAADPQGIIFFLEEKQAELERGKEAAKKMLPALRALEKPAARQSVAVFQGLKGYKSMLDGMLREIGKNGEYDAFASGMLKAELGPYWYRFQTKKKALGITSRCLWGERVRAKKEYLEEYFGKGRFMRSGAYSAPVDTFVYNDNVLQVSYSPEPIFAVLIQSAGMAKSYRELFESLWKAGKG